MKIAHFTVDGGPRLLGCRARASRPCPGRSSGLQQLLADDGVVDQSEREAAKLPRS
jgi:hypothetical protein